MEKERNYDNDGLDPSEGFFIDSGGCRKYFAYGWD